MRELALILLRHPVQFVGTHRLELVEFRPEDFQVEVVAEVDPGGDEEGEVGSDQGVVYVVEGLGCL